MAEALTSLERRILDYLIDYVRRHTYQPSIREIGKRFDIKSTKTVSEHLQVLADKGWIERDPTRSRGVRLLGVDLGAETVTVPCYHLDTGTMAETRDAGESFELDRKLAGANGVFFVAMRGGSMEGAGIRDGDLLLVEPVAADELSDGELVVIQLDNEFKVKRYFKRHGEFVLEAASPDYAPTLVRDAAAFPLSGRVIGVFRRLGVPVATSGEPVAASGGEGESVA